MLFIIMTNFNVLNLFLYACMFVYFPVYFFYFVLLRRNKRYMQYAYTFFGGGTRHFDLLWQHGVYSVGIFFWREDGPFTFLVAPHDLDVPPQLFHRITPLPQAQGGAWHFALFVVRPP